MLQSEDALRSVVRGEAKRSDVSDPQAVTYALKNVDSVFHFAAAVGVGHR